MHFNSLLETNPRYGLGKVWGAQTTLINVILANSFLLANEQTKMGKFQPTTQKCNRTRKANTELDPNQNTFIRHKWALLLGHKSREALNFLDSPKLHSLMVEKRADQP